MKSVEILYKSLKNLELIHKKHDDSSETSKISRLGVLYYEAWIRFPLQLEETFHQTIKITLGYWVFRADRYLMLVNAQLVYPSTEDG